MRIALISPYCPFPPFGGGKSRIYNLYRHMAAEGHLVDMVAMEQETEGIRVGNIELAPGFTQTSIPKTPAHRIKDDEVDKKCGVYIYDASLIYHARLTPAFAAAAQKAIERADAVIISSNTYLFKQVQPFLDDKPLYYEAHDVAYDVKKNLLKDKDSAFTRGFLQDLYDVEAECCQRCAKVFVCSQEDADRMAGLFDMPADKFVVAANGVDTSAICYTPVAQRLANKAKLGLQHEKTGIFLGSAHYPNFEACEHIIAMADKCPDCWFFLMGSQCNEYARRQLPDNVGLLGVVSAAQLNAILSVADFAINPVVSGSGSNVKNFDYMAAGLPVIAAEFALRGIAEKSHFIVAEPQDMPPVINAFSLQGKEQNVLAARRYAEREFDWGVIARRDMLPVIS